MSTKCGQWIYDHILAEMRYYRCTNCADTDVETLAAENEDSHSAFQHLI